MRKEETRKILKAIREEERAATEEEIGIVSGVFADEVAAQLAVYGETIDRLRNPERSRFAAYTLLQPKKLGSW